MRILFPALLSFLRLAAASAQPASLWWGGSSPDEATALTRDAAGNLYVAGTTHSAELPPTGGGLDKRPAKLLYSGDIFVQKHAASGELIWRAVIGGSYLDRASAIAVDREGNVHVAGMTQSPDFPATPSAFRPKIGNPANYARDAFLFKLSPAGDALTYSTFYGGVEGDQATALALDDLGQAVIAGETWSDDLPTTAQSLKPKNCAGYGYDGFAAKFSADGARLLFGTYVCGSGHDHPRALAVDRQGAVYVAGGTASQDFPTTRGVFRERPASPLSDAFVIKLAASGNSAEWATYFGGADDDHAYSFALAPDGGLLIAGDTRSADLPGAGAMPAGLQDGFVARLSPDAKSLEWTVLLGGTGEDRVQALAVAPSADVWAAGLTKSPNFAGEPKGGAALGGPAQGIEDAFIALLPAKGVNPPSLQRLGGRLRDRILAAAATTSGLAATGFTDSAEWLPGSASAGGGQGDAFLLLASSAQFASSETIVPGESRAQRPVTGYSIWSGSGRVPLDPREPLSSGRRWMVELRHPPAAAEHARYQGLRGIARERSLLAERDAVRARQSAARASLAAAGVRVYGSTDLLANLLFVEADPSTAGALSAMPDVLRVLPVGTVSPDLDSSLATHKVAEAWSRLGGFQLAGAGVKIGIIDTGVDSTHPALADPGLAPLEGFPRGNRPADLENTSPKVVVARGYVPFGDKVHSRDDIQHGTGVAIVAGGSPVSTQLGPIAGVAPFAYIGNYKMMTNDPYPLFGDDDLITAIEDAVADGMDVINMSLHTYRTLFRPEDDIFADICERAVNMGTLVVRSTGNEGPEYSTLTAPHLGEWGILVGSHRNARYTATAVELSGGTQVAARPASNVQMDGRTIRARLIEVNELAPGTWACSPYPAGSLEGRIALVDRGVCNFSMKAQNVRNAGAVAMIVMALAESPEPFTMGMADEKLPAFMVSHADGQILRKLTQESGGPVEAGIDLALRAYPSSPDIMATSSSAGPGASTQGIKPDLIATGDDVWSGKPGGAYALMSGTSFSSPHVAGALAVVKGARPGLDPRIYRSLIINSAEPIRDADAVPLPVMKQGAGRLHLDAALASTLSVYPTSLHLGASSSGPSVQTPFRIQNIGADARTCALAAEPRTGPPPTLDPISVQVDPGSESWVVLKWSATGLAPGQYDGHIRVRCEGAEYPLSIPYWHGVRTGRIDNLKIVESAASGKAGATLYWAIQLRLTDEAGLPLDGQRVTATVKEGSGSVVEVVPRASAAPGIYAVHIKPGPGRNVFTVSAGAFTRDITITGE